QALLDFLDPGASEDFTAWHYGVHGRWMIPIGARTKFQPYAIVGAGIDKVKDKYESPTNSDHLSQSVLGLQGGLGFHYWMSPTVGLGRDANYHNAFTSEDEIGHDSVPYLTIAAGLRWKHRTPR